MVTAFLSLIAILIIERIDEKKGTISITPLLIAGIMTIVYWRQAYFSISFTYTSSFPFPMPLFGSLHIVKAPIFDFFPLCCLVNCFFYK